MNLPPLGRAALVAALAAGSGSCALFRPAPPEYDPVVHESGLVVQDLVRAETDLVVQEGDHVSFHYRIALEDGSVVDSSLDRGTPLDVTLLPGELDVPGLAQGLLGMRVLGRRRLYVPPELGYGEEGLPPHVPPNATLIIDLELLQVNGASGS